MFGKLFKKKPKEPVAVNLDFYENKDMYFLRTLPLDWISEKAIYLDGIIDEKPAMITMDPWPQDIYLHADGQSTVSEYVNAKAQQYVDSHMNVPARMAETIIEELEKLVHPYGAIVWKEVKTDLAPNLVLPKSKLKGN